MSVIVRGATERLEREHNERAWLAWHIAALPRAKRMPKLKALMAKRQIKPRQTWQEQQRIMAMWVAVTHQIAAKEQSAPALASSHTTQSVFPGGVQRSAGKRRGPA